MEADWEIEIGADAPVIDAAWEGYVDLRRAPERIVEIRETLQYPSLADTLIRLNSPSSPVWTVKCDVWPADVVDPDEMDADAEHAVEGLACYIDLVPSTVAPRSTTLESILDPISGWCKQLCLHLRTQRFRQSRVDAVARRAFLTANIEGLGVTVYLTACGMSAQEAREVWSRALAILADSVLAVGAPAPQGSKYNEDSVGE